LLLTGQNRPEAEDLLQLAFERALSSLVRLPPGVSVAVDVNE